jgi:hypothetical protein
MAKKRAFVRYGKNGKLVPGSLIVTQGTHPDKPSTWKEVPYDICCGGGGNCETPLSNLILTETTVIPGGNHTGINIILGSEECVLDQILSIPLTSNFLDYAQLINFLNTNFSFLGFFSYTAPDVISLQVSSAGWIGFFANNCPNAESWLFNIQIQNS